jgi:GNAT superfamily N-acetyltransferase
MASLHELWQRGPFEISTDPARLDAEAIHAYLSGSYWAAGRSLETVRKSLAGSYCFGLYDGQAQIGLARAVTDYAVSAMIMDVYVLDTYRGRGLGKWLVECVLASKALASVSGFGLKTKDAHGLYARFGFVPANDGERAMVLRR